MTRRDSRAPSQRQLRVGEEVRHALAWICEKEELRDPALIGITITVTEVRISPDLKNATALGGGDASQVVSALTRASSFLRHRGGEKVQLRHVPRLSFLADASFDQAQHIEDLLHDPKVAQDLIGARTDDGEED